MNLTETFLLGATLTFLIGTPIYLHLRGKMSRSRKHPFSNYSKKRVIKITIINILLHIIAFIQFLGLYLILISRVPYLYPEIVVLSILLLFTHVLIFYGGGIYLTSIVLEAYTIPELTKSKFFETQLIAIKMFHHPISHILVFSGWLFAILFLVFLDMSLGQTHKVSTQPLFLMGVISGLVFAYSQIRNKTAVFHLPAGLLCFILLLINFQLRRLPLSETSLGTYYLGFLAIFNLSLLIFVISLKRRHKKIFKPLAEIAPIHHEG